MFQWRNRQERAEESDDGDQQHRDRAQPDLASISQVLRPHRDASAMARLATWARAVAIDVWHRRSNGRFEVILHRVGPALLAVVAGLVTARYAQLLLYLDELREQWGTDLTLYLGATQRFLGGGTFYLERQLHGPYNGQPGDLFYPPPAVLLFAPFEVLPMILWWCVRFL